jgi:DNA-binding transcriptional LysR family regulator
LLQVANLSQRDADIAVRATTHQPEHLVGHRLGRTHFAIYGAQSLFKGKRAPKNLEDDDWIALDDDLPEDPIGTWCRKNYPKVVPRYRFESLVALAEAVRAGHGIGARSRIARAHARTRKLFDRRMGSCPP